jgi:hypothetical protein
MAVVLAAAAVDSVLDAVDDVDLIWWLQMAWLLM